MFLHEITSRQIAFRRRGNCFRLFVLAILTGLILFSGAARGRDAGVDTDGGAVIHYDDDADEDKELKSPSDVWGNTSDINPLDGWDWPVAGTFAHPVDSFFPWFSGSGNTVSVTKDIEHIETSTGAKGYVLGGMWWRQSNDNTVIIDGADVGKVYGGAAIGTAQDNAVHVRNGATVAQVTGGISVDHEDNVLPEFHAANNRVFITDANSTGIVSGGWNASGEASSTPGTPGTSGTDGIVFGNRVEISGSRTSITTKTASGTAANIYGGYNEGNSDTFDNHVVISGGTITPRGGNATSRQIVGGYSSVFANKQIHNNTVTIAGDAKVTLGSGNQYNGIYGGRSQSALSNGGSAVYSNVVNILGNASIDDGIITGGSAGSANTAVSNVHHNTVNISGGTISGGTITSVGSDAVAVVGGRINDHGVSEYNTVNIKGGNITGRVYGALDASASQDASARFSRVDILGGKVAGNVYGGSANGNTLAPVFGGEAASYMNEVNLYAGGSVTGDVHGGAATTGRAENNAVNLRGMTVEGSLYGGTATDSDTAQKNAVNLYGGTVTEFVYGNNGDKDDWEDGNGWSVAGNTLNAVSGRTDVGGIDRFQTADLADGSWVNVNGDAKSSANFNDLENNGLLSFHNDSLNQDVGRINGGYSGNGQIGLEVKFNKGADPAETDSVVFGSAPATNVVFTFKPAGGSEAAGYADNYANSLFAKTDTGDLVYSTVEPGYGFYSYIFREENDAGTGKKEYFVGLTAADIPERGNGLTDGSATGLTQVALFADTFLRTGLEQAVASICCPNRGWGISASAGYATHRIDTGGDGHADLRGFTGQLALAYNRKGTPVNIGLFGEMFDGTYKTADTASLTGGVFDQNARGDLESYGGGLFFQYRKHLAEAVESGTAPEWVPGPHLEAVVHAGWGVMDFAMTGGDGFSYWHGDKGTPYYGASLGGGYVVDAFPGVIADLYGHGRWVRQGARSAAGHAGESIEIDAADSLRLVAGVRAASRSDGIVRPYAGLAAEWEALGETGARIDGHEAKRTDVSGVSGLVELGVGIRARDCVYVDLKGYGSVGKRRGIGGTLEVMYAF